MLTTVNNISSTNFSAVRGKNYQSFTANQESIIDYLEKKLNTPIKKSAKNTYMQELEKRGTDIYIKPAQEDAISASLVKYKNNKPSKITFLGIFGNKEKDALPAKALAKQRQEDEKIKPWQILLAIAGIAQLMALLYITNPNKAKAVTQNTVDTTIVNKLEKNEVLKDTLKIF